MCRWLNKLKILVQITKLFPILRGRERKMGTIITSIVAIKMIMEITIIADPSSPFRTAKEVMSIKGTHIHSLKLISNSLIPKNRKAIKKAKSW